MQVEATFSWQPTTDADGYRVYVDDVLLFDVQFVGHTIPFDLETGTYVFSIEAYNSVGPGPRASVTREFDATPGAVEGFDVSFLLVGGSSSAPVGGLTDAEADWQSRISGDGVVWYHDFSSDEEVDQFRWTGATLGNDVSNAGDGSVTRNTSDGITGGGCLQIAVPAGGTANTGWARVFSPLTGATNGRGADDPGANGSISAQAWSVVDATDYLGDWDGGYYTHPDYNGANVDGNEFYLSFRCKITGGRDDSGQPPGKLAFIGYSPGGSPGSHNTPSQEIVLQSVPNRILRAYTNFGSNFNSALNDPQEANDSGGNIKQPGGDWNGTCIDNISCAICACWPVDEWFSLMVHIIPGRHGTSLSDANAQNTTFEYFVAFEGDTAWRTIYSKSDYVFDFTSSVTRGVPEGWNVFEPSAYMNNVNANGGQGWEHLYDQIIFSQSAIPVPLV